MTLKTTRASSLFAALASLTLTAFGAVTASAQTTPDALYQWQFASGGQNTGTHAGGQLSITNGAAGSVAFSNGTLNLSGNVRGSANQSGIATSALGNVGTLNQFTVTFWVNAASLPTSGTYQNLLGLGTSNSFGAGDANSLSVRLNGDKLEVFIGSRTGTAGTQSATIPALSSNEWVFIAISYDGTSTRVDNSVTQAAATGTTDNRGNANLQVYIGSSVTSTALNRTGIHYGLSDASFGTNKGPLELGNDAYLQLGNRPALDRGLVGSIDDIHIYDSVLSSSQIDALRLGYLSTIPEPSTYALLLGIGAIGAGVCLRRRRS